MEEFLKRCERVRVKCRAEDMLLSFRKKRKLENDRCGETESLSPAAFCCSNSKHEDSSDVVEMSPRSADLENAEISTSTGRVLREATPSSELYGDSEQILLPKKESSTTLRRKIPKSMPSAAELEGFFAAAEKYEQKRFAEKYNYDIVKDVPLEDFCWWIGIQHFRYA
ncbi:cyclin-dependent kinase inhibitor 7-like isoform X2 [Salvia splendens]|uniref:cyclin-dependent kinase inhibitor 7-like isoform X2 n=1 Tax=Salvia splendens TaxID=180675 RepID=UPI001C27C04D|nr:cyclin-dependent kinase inhibitor 7-like isoform X2 [Salvia splendens]